MMLLQPAHPTHYVLGNVGAVLGDAREVVRSSTNCTLVVTRSGVAGDFRQRALAD
jgi:hypothetical protein